MPFGLDQVLAKGICQLAVPGEVRGRPKLSQRLLFDRMCVR
jgi:hypothetical protein